MSELKPEHGTLQAYITGFILSLLFTFIPYFLVVNKTATGTALLAIILGFGVLQMIVQVLFFLHLGRGPKPNWQLFFLLATVFAILVVVGGSIIITSNLHHNMLLTPSDQVQKLANDEGIYQVDGKKTGACQGQHPNHRVVIKNSKVNPLHTEAKQCDTLTFMNEDKLIREIAFGEHDHHIPYAGETEYIVQKNQNQTITLSELGTYKFHDHLHEETTGNFTVTN